VTGTPPRTRAQAIATGRDGQHTLAVPRALRLAARIQERPLDEFFTDPTQLANGLTELIEAVHPDGVVVTEPDVLEEEITSTTELATSPRISTAVEATHRLRNTSGDTIALVALLPGPARIAAHTGDQEGAAEIAQTLVQTFLGAGLDAAVLVEHRDADVAAHQDPLRTIANMARFHRALTHLLGAPSSVLPAPSVVPLDLPQPAAGLVLTDGDLPTDTDITLVQDWVAAVSS